MAALAIPIARTGAPVGDNIPASDIRHPLWGLPHQVSISQASKWTRTNSCSGSRRRVLVSNEFEAIKKQVADRRVKKATRQRMCPIRDGLRRFLAVPLIEDVDCKLRAFECDRSERSLSGILSDAVREHERAPFGVRRTHRLTTDRHGEGGDSISPGDMSLTDYAASL